MPSGENGGGNGGGVDSELGSEEGDPWVAVVLNGEWLATVATDFCGDGGSCSEELFPV